MLQGCAATSPHLLEGAMVPINAIQPQSADGKTELVIEGAQPLLNYTSYQLTEPLRLVVDITDASVGKFTDRIAVNQGVVVDINPSQADNIARLEIGLTEPVDTRLYQSGGKLMVEFGKGTAAAKAEPAPAPPQPEPAPVPSPEKPEAEAPMIKPASVVTAVKATATKEGATVVITGDGAMNPKTFMLKDGRIVVDIPGVKSKVRQNVIPVRKGGVARVRVAQYSANVVRAVLDVTKPMQYAATAKNNTVVIAMSIASTAKAEEKPPVEKAASAALEAPPVSEKEAAPAPAPPPVKEPAALRAAPLATDTTLIGSGKYSGRRISLDFQDADLVNVMRLFAEVANLNIILSPDVKGKVTVRMVNIPWDQAMDIILKMNGLGYSMEDNILRIASLPALAKEAQEELAAKEAKKKAEDLLTRVIAINYSTAKGIEGTLKKSLSARGEMVVDERTNTLIIKDIARSLDDIVSLIKVLDKPIAQVLIEARIVEASLNFNRSIGVQWGGSGAMSAATGNPTGFTFPSSIGVTGGPTMGETPSGSGNFFVNLPAPAGAGSGGAAVGISFGSLSKALNLDLVLSALETTGEGKVISQPRVSALDNKEAKIEQGLSIPFSTVSATGTQIQFVDAKLSLTVTPHVTPDNKIFMKISATKNAPDTSLLGASGQPSIRKNEAQTEILLADGETAVIGGILTIDRGTTIDKIPFFGDIPLIGWLFTKKTVREEKRELIIFITPKIVKQETV
jgi:type IV pilus assembly protein PilQ